MTQKHQKLFQCLCEYCENIKLKLTSLNKLVEQSGRLDLKINDIYEAVDGTMCGKEKEERYHKLSCIDGKYDQCGTNLLKEKLKPIFNDEVSVVKWNAWSVVKSVNPKTGKEITKGQKVVKCGPPSELVATLIVELESHPFEAWWQQ